MKKILIGVLFLALVGAGLYLYFGYQSAQRAQASAIQVQTSKIETGILTAYNLQLSAVGGPFNLCRPYFFKNANAVERP